MRSLSARTVLLASLVTASIWPASMARADASRCPELERRFDTLAANGTQIEFVALGFTAADNGCEALVARLLDRGVSPSARDREGNSTLARAAKAGHAGVVKLLIERGSDLEQRNLQGGTPLFVAAQANRPRIVQMLAEAGARIDAPGRTGVTPLAAAAFNGNQRLVEFFLGKGVDAKELDATGKGPAVYAAARGFADIVRVLLDAGVPVDLRYGNDLTLLMWAAGHANDVPEADGVRTVDLVLQRGATVEALDNRGRSALMIAAEQDHAAIAKRLIAAGADPSRRDNEGKTAADLATSIALREALAR